MRKRHGVRKSRLRGSGIAVNLVTALSVTPPQPRPQVHAGTCLVSRGAWVSGRSPGTCGDCSPARCRSTPFLAG